MYKIWENTNWYNLFVSLLMKINVLFNQKLAAI